MVRIKNRENYKYYKLGRTFLLFSADGTAGVHNNKLFCELKVKNIPNI